MGGADETDGGQTYPRILQGALELFAARGFGGTGIRDIATAAGLRTSGLYHYMQAKEDLLFEIIQRGLTASIAASNESIAGEQDPVTRMALLAATTVVIHAEYQRTYLVIDNEFHFVRGETLTSTIALRDQIDAIWRDALEAGLASSAFTADDPNLARLSLLSMYRGVAQWYSPRGSATVPELANKLAGLGLSLLQVDRERANASVPAPDSWLMRRILHIVGSTHAEVPR